MRYLFVLALLLSGCAAQPVELFARGAPYHGTGTFSRADNTMRLTLDGGVYTGKAILLTSSVGGIFDSHAAANKMSALLLGPGGQISCEFSYDPMWTSAIGTCHDFRGITYDVRVNG